MVILFDQAFRDLSLVVPMAEVEIMARLVNQSMSASTRAFHNATHVFNMCEGMKPLQVLAALFHDVVYVQVDKGLPAPAIQLLQGVTRSEGDGLILQPVEPGDKSVPLCSEIFGFSPGVCLPPTAGMNEFLSAVVACRLLQRHLSDTHLVTLVTFIAATVPFRVPDARGQSAADKLAQRLLAYIDKPGHELAGSAAEAAAFVKSVITDAVTLANRDVSGFTDADPRHCLSNTWLLLKEANPAFQLAGVFGLQAYREALQRSDGFLAQLKPARVCQSYDAYPSAAVRLALDLAIQKNLAFSRDYLAVELCFIAIIEALARETGGDCPVALLLGEGGPMAGVPDLAEDVLPTPLVLPASDSGLLAQLEHDHACTPDAINDLCVSPLKPWVYRCMGRAGTEQTLMQAQRMFAGALPAHDFLQTLDRALLQTIIDVCQKIAPSRRQALLRLASDLPQSAPTVL